MANQIELFARCAGGFEEVLAQELRSLGMRRIRPLKGGVAFFGQLADAYKACLWSRVATRIQLVLARISAGDADELYEGAHSFPWENHIGFGATLSVDAHGQNPSLRNTKFTALKVKDAVCDRMRNGRGERPNIDTQNPDFALDVALHQSKATLYLNLSGASLHRRGYREDGVQTEAPLKETLAAGMLLAAGWPAIAQNGGVLVDPMCGSGTIAVEAALMATKTPAGLLREHWGFEGWLGHNQNTWHEVLAEAKAQCKDKHYAGSIVAGDIDPSAVEIARGNARRAGVDKTISLYVDDAKNLERHLRFALRSGVPGILVTNPPYGHRISSLVGLPVIRAALATAIDALPPTWRVALISPDAGIDSVLGRSPHKAIACHNGPIETSVRVYDLAEGERQAAEVVSLGGKQQTVPCALSSSVQFAARLRKTARERVRWARRTMTTAYRIYDADLPEYPLTIDVYLSSADDTSERWLRLEEHPQKRRRNSELRMQRLADASAIAGAVLDVPATRIVELGWQEDWNASSVNEEPLYFMIEERGLKHCIDIAARPSTGLSLMQREVRALVRDRAAGKSVVSLFGSSSAALVSAASVGAKAIVGLDTSKARIDLLEQTLKQNRLAHVKHQLLRTDARTWLERESRARHTYDFILCAPPTWMPARKGDKRDWQLKRDYVTLLRRANGLLRLGGTLLFITCAPGFSVDPKALGNLGLRVEDVSTRLLPHDFERSRHDFCCLLLTAR